ncbi:MAG: DUF2271 domain-containing protein [Treponema sp.]|nr:DUF2271 domain-containing protein [Treponema sp.]
MKNIFLIILTTMFMFSCTSRTVAESAPQHEQSTDKDAVLEITFTFTRLRGVASNQFAVWVEDSQGQYVTTLYATRWTARGGWRRRPTSIPEWVRASGAAERPSYQIDAVSGATPSTGTLTYTWDGTDSEGRLVPDGEYTIILEGTLRWANQVYFRAPINLGQGSVTAEVTVEYVGDATDDRAMISNVSVQVLR